MARWYATATNLTGHGITTKRGQWYNSIGSAPAVYLMTVDKSDEANNGAFLRTVGTDGIVGHGHELWVGAYPLTVDTMINGTVDICFPSYGGSDYTWDHHWHVHIYVTIQNSGAVRGTVLNNYQDPSGSTNRLPPQIPAPETRSLTSVQSLTAVQGFAGDYVIVEVGYYQGALNGTITARALAHGCRNNAGTINPDYVPNVVADTGNLDGATWVEFALIPTPPPPPPGTCPPCGTVPGTNPDPIGPLPPWVQTCTGGGLVDSVADLADGEDWAA